MPSSQGTNSEQSSIQQQMSELWDTGHASYTAGDFQAAEAQLQRLVELQQRVYGMDDDRTLFGMSMQGMALSGMHRDCEAEALYREVLQIKQQSAEFGMEALSTLASVLLLGECLVNQERYKDAEPMLRKVHATDVRVLGPRDGITLKHQMILGECLMHDNQLEEAEQLLRDAWEGAKLTEGTNPGFVVEVMHNMACCMSKAGKYTEAETILRAAVKLCRHRIGEHAAQTLQCILSHASILTALDQWPAAEIMYRLGVQGYWVVHAWANPLATSCHPLNATHEWLECLIRLKKVEAVEGVLRDTLKHVKQDLGDAHPTTGYWMIALAQVLLTQGHPKALNEAIALFQKAAALGAALPEQQPG